MIPFSKTSLVVDGIDRFVPLQNYSRSFGFQWNRFSATQIDREAASARFSEERLFLETGWERGSLDGMKVLEAGSGAGRFTKVLLQCTRAVIYSFDYSSAVEANRRNTEGLAAGRLCLFQASIYDIPFPDDSFDRVLCIGVLQHTPDFGAAVAALIAKAKPGGEIVVDFYPIRGWWTKVHAKYLLRPFTKRMAHDRLLKLIDRHIDRLIDLYRALKVMHLGVLTRFLPMADIDGTLPAGLSERAVREWVVLDTFDMFSPEHDHPQTIDAVAAMFRQHGAEVTFAGELDGGSGRAAVVRAVKPSPDARSESPYGLGRPTLQDYAS